jgi:capsule biosynthesis phosphatase
MRICIDLDGVICQLKKEKQTYDQLEPIPGAIEKLKKLKAAGHYIIIQTARHMKTCEGNVGRVQARIGAATLNWLEKNNVPYDEIYFGKPWAQIYIDDNAYRFENWDVISDDGSNFPANKEETFASTNK